LRRGVPNAPSMNLDGLNARINRLDGISRGLGKELNRWKQGKYPLLPPEQAEYVEQIRWAKDGIIHCATGRRWYFVPRCAGNQRRRVGPLQFAPIDLRGVVDGGPAAADLKPGPSSPASRERPHRRTEGPGSLTRGPPAR